MMLSRHESDSQRNFPYSGGNLAVNNEENAPQISKIEEANAHWRPQAPKKKQYIANIYESIQHGKDAEKRNLEQAAMSKLIEMAYKRQRVSHGSHSSKRVFRRVNKQAALPFAERTLAKCLEFEDTGRNCFRKALLVHQWLLGAMLQGEMRSRTM
ncbi:hypothetical protein ACET3Z_006163 [Daucus carota]